MAQKPGIPKGTRDFVPAEAIRRNFIFNTIRSVFELFGYLPIETPAMENLSTLLGKYGEEGDKLLFKILNSGDYLQKVNSDLLHNGDSNGLSSEISEKGLRYDLTVPFARFVVQHQNELVFPFKRYQIQPVWRADRPQKGRYREFYQCDADVIGSNSLLNELDLIQIIDEVFKRFQLKVNIKINHRKLLSGLADIMDAPDKLIDLTVAIDKLDKIGLEAVLDELRNKGIDESAIEKLLPVLNLKGSSMQKLQDLRILFEHSELGLQGVTEMEQMLDFITLIDLQADLEIDLSLARGLNYYTGVIIEVKSNEVEIGSITGGGRYDDLTGIFGLPGMSGVGISFGADRIYDVLLQLDRFPEQNLNQTKLLLINFGGDDERYAIQVLQKIRAAGVNAELYPDAAKLKKQFAYADKRDIPNVLIIGAEERSSHHLTMKNMRDGSQNRLSIDDLIQELKGNN